MKSPLTRYRERRILTALSALGPLDDSDLSHWLNVCRDDLSTALLNLAVEGRVVAKCRTNMISGNSYLWSLPGQVGNNDD